MFLNVFFSDLNFSFGHFDVLVDIKEYIAFLKAEIPVDFADALVKGLKFFNKPLFGVPQFLEAGVELFLLFE